MNLYSNSQLNFTDGVEFVWRSEKQVGVQYVSLPKATPDSKGIEPLLAGKAESEAG